MIWRRLFLLGSLLAAFAVGFVAVALQLAPASLELGIWAPRFDQCTEEAIAERVEDADRRKLVLPEAVFTDADAHRLSELKWPIHAKRFARFTRFALLHANLSANPLICERLCERSCLQSVSLQTLDVLHQFILLDQESSRRPSIQGEDASRDPA